MTQLHRTERNTRCWPEDRDKYATAQRRHGREVVRVELDDYDRRGEALDRCACSLCGRDVPGPEEAEWLRAFPVAPVGAR